MRRFIPVISALVLAALALPAMAQAPQRIVRFAAGTTTGTESVTPTLTWCTETLGPGVAPGAGFTCAATPRKPAASCTATGPANWAGTKAAAGTVTLPAITVNTTYALSCSWPDDTTIEVNWTNPTTNTDGSPLTDLDRVVFGFRQGAGTITSGCVAPTRCEGARPPTAPRTYSGFATGTWRIVAWAVNTGGIFSEASAETTKVNLPAESIARDVTITVAGKPNVVTGIEVF